MNQQYIDTHAHLNLSAFREDVDVVGRMCADESVAVINVGTKESTSAKAVELAQQYAHCYAIVGLHPIQTLPGHHDEDEIGEGGTPLTPSLENGFARSADQKKLADTQDSKNTTRAGMEESNPKPFFSAGFTSKGEAFDSGFYRELAKHEKVVGIGECGFDFYHHNPATRDVQEEQFVAQVKLANELGLPLMIHTRSAPDGSADAYEDVYRVLKQHAKVPGNVHFYAGSWEQAKRFFDIGFTISFTGVITFAKDYAEVVRNAPLDMIHAETDCPYVAPVPHRGKRCEPWMVKEVYKTIAEIRNEDEEKVRMQLMENACTFYGLNV